MGEGTTWTERGEAKGKGPCHMARWGIGGKEGNGVKGDTTWKGPTGLNEERQWESGSPVSR
jgi:hypothetical protein